MIRTLVALLLIGSVAQAEVIDLNFSNLALVFEDGVLRDANPSGPTDVFVTIFDGSPKPQGFIPQTVAATLDLELPGLGDLDVNVPATSAPGGWLTVVVPGGESIQLSLDEVQITYTDLLGIAVFGSGTETSTTTVDPNALSQTPPASLVFSATVSDSQVEAGKVQSFNAEATGQVQDAALIPEPATGVIVGLMALIGSAAAAMRANLC